MNDRNGSIPDSEVESTPTPTPLTPLTPPPPFSLSMATFVFCFVCSSEAYGPMPDRTARNLRSVTLHSDLTSLSNRKRKHKTVTPVLADFAETCVCVWLVCVCVCVCVRACVRARVRARARACAVSYTHLTLPTRR